MKFAVRSVKLDVRYLQRWLISGFVRLVVRLGLGALAARTSRVELAVDHLSITTCCMPLSPVHAVLIEATQLWCQLGSRSV